MHLDDVHTRGTQYHFPGLLQIFYLYVPPSMEHKSFVLGKFSQVPK